jgi:cyclophilin family peptidyl-prolyl cis-trans isomerase
MRSYLSLCIVLLAAGSMLSVTGCSDGGDDGQVSLDDSLASIEKARKDAEWSKAAAALPADTPQSTPLTAPSLEASGDEPQKGTFTVKVESSAGDYTIEVHRDWAPIGAERFYQLVKAGFYDECRYFRVVPGFMVQFGLNGDPAVQRQWERKIQDDTVTQSNKKGYVTFATSGKDSRTTQIFINFDDNSFLDAQDFAPFGMVIDGMQNVDAINSKYGETPDQGSIQSSGNAYLQQSFPELDFVKKMSIVSETTE